MTNYVFASGGLWIATLLFMNPVTNAAFAGNSKQLALGTQLIDTHRFEAAVALFHQMVRDDPKDAAAWHGYGSALDGDNSSKEAVDAFTRAIELGDKNWTAYKHRGVALMHLGKFEQAIDDLNFAIRSGMPGAITYSKSETYADRAGAELVLHRYDNAVQDYTKSLELAPKEASYSDRISRRARAYAGSGKTKEAIADMTKLLQAKETKARVKIGGHIYRSLLYAQMKDYDKAISDLSDALAIDPRRSDILRTRAKLYDQIGKKDLAEKDRTRIKLVEREEGF
jgi:tetratricopeptide (TPR) repeat protein